MKTYTCECGETLYFDNNLCTRCKRAVGWCDACGSIAARGESGECLNPKCKAPTKACRNGAQQGVCNGYTADDNPLCKGCRRTKTIPDTTDAQQVRQWALLEAGKRRLLYDLQTVGITEEMLDGPPPLAFRFMADTPAQHVTTGHAEGVITINLAEADPVQREMSRQQFGEPQRTIIGHFRHEVGHYLFSLLVEGQQEAECIEVFGDHNDPAYAEAMPRYYQEGPPADWPLSFISQYASSHPWEDFAETCGFYLDMRAVLDTLRYQYPHLAPKPDASFEQMLAAYLKAGVALNEVNRTMGLTDLVPEVVSDPVIDKLRYFDRLLA